MAKTVEYYNLFVGFDIKDLPETQALVGKLFEMQKEGNKKPIFTSGKDGSTYKNPKTGEETTKEVVVFLNKDKNGKGYATVKIESEGEDDGNPF